MNLKIMNLKMVVALYISVLFCCESTTSNVPPSAAIDPYTAEGGPIFISTGIEYDCYQYAFIDNRVGGVSWLGTHWLVTGNDYDIANYVDSAVVDWDTCWCGKK